MTLSRKEFFKKACLTGACMCGFGSLVLSAKNSSETSALTEEEDKRLTLVQEYLGGLLLNMQENLGEEENRKNIKQLAQVHYKQLNMDEFLKPYENNLDGFISFIEKEWSWKITYNKSTQMIIADENKSYCVCPMINHKAGIKAAALCYCSEGFAETMFSKVVGHKVNAKVISSIQRGNDRCKYEISLS
jgi:predicted hydrocarbon binding protein